MYPFGFYKQYTQTKSLMKAYQRLNTGMTSNPKQTVLIDVKYPCFSQVLFIFMISGIILAHLVEIAFLQLGQHKYKILVQSKFKDSDHTNAYSVLNDIRIKNINRLIIAHLNINSIRNKIEMLTDIILGKLDILLLSETKIDNSFSREQFKIPGFSIPYRLDRSYNTGGGLLLYIRSDIPS